ncbi:glycosyltransferase family 2 protein [Vibrio aestuarianus]|uniref:glycosyltransferase family 2 protein n=1 Tax=Vibrio aestuarianus TaxID=28171 RepID=UPI00237C923E|nr:glycosyltransferase family 2 protein [Vibrio aestuarianus]MDE1264192.1 glycosyltransferase family 2 protein [Vibrio aestuarianus]MDE1296039.1 glycosyltransferase family 2 protein [Vibrio aestuarianus]
MELSVVIPVYGACESLDELISRLTSTLKTKTNDFEIILVNDASPDRSWDIIKENASIDPRVKGINLSRNFGQHRAINAGLAHSQGRWVVVMDCDLQDRPEDICILYEKALEDFDVVFGKRTERKDSFLKKLSSKVFYRVYDYLTGYKTDHSIANFSIISRKVVNSYLLMKEQHKPYGYFVNWLGFKRVNIDVNHAQRPQGHSSYTFKKLLQLASDNIISQSNKPLRMSIKFGFSMSLFSMLYSVYLVFQYVINDVPVAGWTSVMVSIYFVSGIILANLGFVGLYIGKVFDETKGRPMYVVDELTFNKDDN